MRKRNMKESNIHGGSGWMANAYDVDNTSDVIDNFFLTVLKLSYIEIHLQGYVFVIYVLGPFSEENCFSWMYDPNTCSSRI